LAGRRPAIPTPPGATSDEFRSIRGPRAEPLHGVTMDAVPTSTAAPATAPTGSSVWSEIREALRGTHRDLTEAPLGRSLFVLAVPMVLEMAMESLFAVTDSFFVGRLGAEAQATVGLTETMETMVYALSFGLSIGATSLVARRMGEKDEEAAARTAV